MTWVVAEPPEGRGLREAHGLQRCSRPGKGDLMIKRKKAASSQSKADAPQVSGQLSELLAEELDLAHGGMSNAEGGGTVLMNAEGGGELG
jgi:hypothetical protein